MKYLYSGSLLLFLFAGLHGSCLATTTLFSGTTGPVGSTFNLVGGEDGDELIGWITDRVSVTATPLPQNLGTPSTITFRFLAPTGSHYRFDSSGYSGQAARLNSINELRGFSSAFFNWGVGNVQLINPTGSLAVSGAVSSGIRVEFYNKWRLEVGADVSGVGTFDGIEFSIGVTGAEDVPVDWIAYGSDIDAPTVNPNFTAEIQTLTNNGAVLSLVPEPASGLLVASSLCALALLRRRAR